MVVADGIQQHDGVAAFIDDQTPEVFNRVGEWKLSQYATQRSVETLSHAPS